MVEENFSAENSEVGVEVTLSKDTRVFRKVGPNSGAVKFQGWLKEGTTIVVGESDDIVDFDFDHKPHDFVPWLDDPIRVEEDETSVSYIKTKDLPQDW